ncbi:hypothetical protein AOQ73_05715 [Bradyrhizobium pachyrhizi]|uniref:hypothetical protein n=1 Tax=Bradyrhizobium pachyrhizi TaxID=280333 RepID=UPI0007051888|nr:hypothetical protein [Bradyrhizobium pachyrhizi]KRQ11904.1 hypothetical protein AOQ73_05715 [Bradyrhizobium pachyrhizi]
MTVADLTRDQLNFLALHVRRVVFMWRWVFRESMLIADAGSRFATIARAELDDLISRGLMIRGSGADVYPTPDGKALLA